VSATLANPAWNNSTVLKGDLLNEASRLKQHIDGGLDPQAGAELAVVAAVIAVDTGSDAAAVAARQRLAPLLAGIQDPFLHAASQLAMAWTLPITGDFDGALRDAAVSLEEPGRCWMRRWSGAWRPAACGS